MLKTFEKEDDLPSLPLPELDSSLSLYLDSVKALCIDEDKLAKTIDVTKDPKLKILHEELARKSQQEKNWVSYRICKGSFL